MVKQLIQGLNRSTGTDRGLYVEIKKPAEHRSHGLDPSKAVLSLLKKYGYESRDDNDEFYVLVKFYFKQNRTKKHHLR